MFQARKYKQTSTQTSYKQCEYILFIDKQLGYTIYKHFNSH